MGRKRVQQNNLFFATEGRPDAPIVLIGEAWGWEEYQQQKPFVGGAGTELRRMLGECQIPLDQILFTNVVNAQPHANNMWTLFDEGKPKQNSTRGLFPTQAVVANVQRLHEQIRAHPRKLIISAGNYPLWAVSNLTGASKSKSSANRFVPTGVGNYRGSMTYADVIDPALKLLPIYHPSAILRQWDLRTPTIHDLRARVPMALRDDWKRARPPIYWAPPTFDQARSRLTLWLRDLDGGKKLRLSCDIETTRGLIACIGFADSINFAMSIPFMKRAEPYGFDSYYPRDEEAILARLIGRVLSHPNVLLEGQNFIYDTQYIHRWLGVLPYCDFDTMLAFHLLFPGIEKGLDYLSSLFCTYHSYWKDDGKEWDTSGTTIEQLLSYNCEDLVRTFEVATALRALILRFGMDEQWEWVKKKRDLALRMMVRGVRVDEKRRNELGFQMLIERSDIDTRLENIVPQSVVPAGSSKIPWYHSASQTKWVLGEYLGMQLPKDRKTKSVTTGKEALNELPKKYPQWARLFHLLEASRSIGVFISTFIRASLDPDGRLRCSFNPAGTETFRWSSSKNPFGGGGNLQNIPKGTED
jgi:uracil-DNA glycosylase family 4